MNHCERCTWYGWVVDPFNGLCTVPGRPSSVVRHDHSCELYEVRDLTRDPGEEPTLRARRTSG